MSSKKSTSRSASLSNPADSSSRYDLLRLVVTVVVVAALICGVSMLLWAVTKSEDTYKQIDRDSSELWKPGKDGFVAIWMGLYVLQALAFVGLAKKANKKGAKLAFGLLLMQLLVGWAWISFLKETCDRSVPTIMIMAALSLAASVVAARVCPGAAVAIAPTFVWLSYATAISSKSCGSESSPSHLEPAQPASDASAQPAQPASDASVQPAQPASDASARPGPRGKSRPKARKDAKPTGGPASSLPDSEDPFVLPQMDDCCLDAALSSSRLRTF